MLFRSIGEATSTSKLDQLLVEYKKMIDLCKENDITVYAIPITQFKGGSYYTESSESMRQSINAFLRSEEAGINGIIDFESALADPKDSNKISDDYTYDFLHPSKGDGYRVMADAIDLSLFE